MSKLIFTIFLFSFFSTNTYAFIDVFEDIAEITIENPDLTCSSKETEEELNDLVLYIDVENQRVAQAGQDSLELGDNTGLQINVTSFRSSRCPHCHTIKGTHLGNNEVRIDLQGVSHTEAKGFYEFGGYTIELNCYSK